MSLTAPGSPFYLARQAERLALTPAVAHQCRNSPELHKLATIVGGLDLHLNDPHRPGKRRVLPLCEVDRLTKALEDLEIYNAKLHLMAAAGDDMIETTYKLFGIERKRRSFEIMADSDFAKKASPPDPQPSSEPIAEAAATGDAPPAREPIDATHALEMTLDAIPVAPERPAPIEKPAAAKPTPAKPGAGKAAHA